ncbi:hypothetical protein [Flavobacterium sp.]|uniref:hypothetical protein n=1 Tax=Flavobacterium sp. TaxID=239 RepID=UPI0025DCBB2A|nr:hypothetical protein [Flavobacterium sp.]
MLENLNNNHYDASEKVSIDANLKLLEAAIDTKLVALSKQERQKYGSVNEQNKLIVNKVRDLRTSNPELSDPSVDWVEFMNDFESRAFSEAILFRIKKLVEGIENKKILHDFDNYSASLKDYGYSQYKAGSGKAGYQSKVDELSQFFNRTGVSKNAGSNPQ